MKPFSEAADRNKEPILAVLRDAFADRTAILEIGAGTGQHAVHFAPQLSHLRWLVSDRAVNLDGIRAWVADHAADNLPEPIALDVDDEPWRVPPVDGVYTANTLHIVSWPRVCRMFKQVAELLPEGGLFCTYGPFNVDGRFTSESNANFDVMLRQRDPASGIRDITDLSEKAWQHGLILEADHAMPANNRLLVWRKTATP